MNLHKYFHVAISFDQEFNHAKSNSTFLPYMPYVIIGHKNLICLVICRTPFLVAAALLQPKIP